MDPVTVLTVFFQIATYLPNEQGFMKNKNNEPLSRTQVIELYRKDMEKNSTSNSNPILLFDFNSYFFTIFK